MIKTQNFQRNGKKFLSNGIPVAIAWTTSVDRGLAAACAARTWHLSCPRTKNAALTSGAGLHHGAGAEMILPHERMLDGDATRPLPERRKAAGINRFGDRSSEVPNRELPIGRPAQGSVASRKPPSGLGLGGLPGQGWRPAHSSCTISPSLHHHPGYPGRRSAGALPYPQS